MHNWIHKGKSYLTILYDRCETLRKHFSDEEIGVIIRALIDYELDGKKPQIEDRTLMVQVETLCNDVDFMTEKARKKSNINSDNATRGWKTRRKQEERADRERYLEETVEMYDDM